MRLSRTIYFINKFVRTTQRIPVHCKVNTQNSEKSYSKSKMNNNKKKKKKNNNNNNITTLKNI